MQTFNESSSKHYVWHVMCIASYNILQGDKLLLLLRKYYQMKQEVIFPIFWISSI